MEERISLKEKKNVEKRILFFLDLILYFILLLKLLNGKYNSGFAKLTKNGFIENIYEIVEKRVSMKRKKPPKIEIYIILDKRHVNNFIYYSKYFKKLGRDTVNVITQKKIVENKTLTSKCEFCNFIDESIIYPKLTKQYLIDICLKRNLTQIQRSKCMEIPKNYKIILKLAVSFYTKAEYFLVWDADTIPLRDYKPYFNKKNNYKTYFDHSSIGENHKPYFNTMDALLGLKKMYEYSFICEYMIMNKYVTQEILFKIENNNKLPGSNWIENIVYCLDSNNIRLGLSEFELYGTYVFKYYHDFYEYKYTEHLRYGTQYFKSPVSDELLEYAAKDYATITFEAYDKLNTKKANFIENKKNREKYTLKEIINDYIK